MNVVCEVLYGGGFSESGLRKSNFCKVPISF
jgi:hypothetical protein